MDDLVLARLLHVLALVHWIGGVFMVTTSVLPSLIGMTDKDERLRRFDAVERRFANQARVSTLLAGASGLWMTHRLEAWERFADPGFWWMHAMVAIWLVFTVMLFVAEPIWLHDWFERRAARDPDGTFALVLRLHRVLLTLSLITVAGAVAGSHGGLW